MERRYQPTVAEKLQASGDNWKAWKKINRSLPNGQAAQIASEAFGVVEAQKKAPVTEVFSIKKA